MSCHRPHSMIWYYFKLNMMVSFIILYYWYLHSHTSSFLFFSSYYWPQYHYLILIYLLARSQLPSFHIFPYLSLSLSLSLCLSLSLYVSISISLSLSLSLCLYLFSFLLSISDSNIYSSHSLAHSLPHSYTWNTTSVEDEDEEGVELTAAQSRKANRMDERIRTLSLRPNARRLVDF